MVSRMLVLGLAATSALPMSPEQTHASAPEDAHLSRRQLLSQGTMYCYSDSLTLGCEAEPVSSPACGTDSATTSTFCALPDDNVRGVDKDRWLATYAFDHCSDRLIYVKGGDSCDAEGATCNYYCKVLESTGDWSTRRREVATDNAESKGTSWWWCGWWSGYEWHDGRCQHSTRYLGESCWDGPECYNDGIKAYDGLHMSCAAAPGVATTPTCIPSAFEIERNQCECNWFDWHFFFACGSSQCNGHPCVLSTGDGNRYCDYQADNNW